MARSGSTTAVWDTVATCFCTAERVRRFTPEPSTPPIGEMGLVAQNPRSATIQAEVASVLYVLSTHQFEAIKQDDPTLAQKLLTYFVSVMAERLAFASRTIAVLRR